MSFRNFNPITVLSCETNCILGHANMTHCDLLSRFDSLSSGFGFAQTAEKH